MATPRPLRFRRLLLFCVYPLSLLLLNLIVIGKEFGVQYTAYLESNEGSFIAIARNLLAHPADLLWWPAWDLGLPYQNTYLPGLHVIVAAWSALTGASPGLSFHQVCAIFYALGPVAVYAMAAAMTRLPGTSWFAALAYSIVSPSAWLLPNVRYDMGGPWNLRRLQIFAYYGEGPHTASLFFVPLAVLFLYLAVTKGRMWMKVTAGVVLGLAVLMNAFGGVIAGIVAFSMIAASPPKHVVRNALTVFVIGALAYLWISPLLPPSVLSDIRTNSHREYPFNAVSALGLGNLIFAVSLLWAATRYRLSMPVRVFLFLTLIVSSIVLLDHYAGCNLVPQPHRYGVTTDMALCLSAAFGLGAVVRRLPRPALTIAIAVLICLAAVQGWHAVRYARKTIRGTDVTQSRAYHVASWMKEHMGDRRVFIGGAQSFHFNAFTDTPQLHGGHDPMMPSDVTLIGSFLLASGMNTGDRDAEICGTWLKALGVHAFSIPGPADDFQYRTFPHPERFHGHFPELWREGETTIYAVPQRSQSLAHVVPEDRLARRLPVNGLDTGELNRYVAALDDPAMPEASFRWLTRHSAEIEAKLQPGQVVSIQERYMPGWSALVNGRPRKIDADGLGLMVVKAACTDCRITINYDGGPQTKVCAAASLAVTLLALALLLRPVLMRPRYRLPEAPPAQP